MRTMKTFWVLVVGIFIGLGGQFVWATVTVTTPPAVVGTKLNSSGNSTTCTLNGASPATCTATVSSGATCMVTVQGTTAADATAGDAYSISGTTITVVSGNGHTNVVSIWCDR
jgi:hypothetical protein